MELRLPGFFVRGKWLFFQGLIQGGFEHPELLVTHDAAVVLLGLDEACSCPAENHVATLPVRDSPRSMSHAAVGGINEIGGTQAASQRGGQIEPTHGEHFIEPFTQAGGSTGPIFFEPLSVLQQLRLAFLFREFPGCLQRRAGLIMLVFGKMSQHVAKLVLTATLHRLVRALHLIDGGSQGLGSIDYEQSPPA